MATSEVGWYAAAARIIAIPIFIPTLVVTPLFPALSRSVHQPEILRRTIAQALKVVLLLTVPLFTGSQSSWRGRSRPCLVGLPISAVSVPLMRIMSLQLPLVSIGMVLGAATMAIGRRKAVFPDQRQWRRCSTSHANLLDHPNSRFSTPPAMARLARRS